LGNAMTAGRWSTSYELVVYILPELLASIIIVIAISSIVVKRGREQDGRRNEDSICRKRRTRRDHAVGAV
jgi:hypothetical protein